MIITPFAPSLINPLKPCNEIMRKNCEITKQILSRERLSYLINIYTCNILMYIYFFFLEIRKLCDTLHKYRRDKKRFMIYEKIVYHE